MAKVPESRPAPRQRYTVLFSLALDAPATLKGIASHLIQVLFHATLVQRRHYDPPHRLVANKQIIKARQLPLNPAGSIGQSDPSHLGRARTWPRLCLRSRSRPEGRLPSTPRTLRLCSRPCDGDRAPCPDLCSERRTRRASASTTRRADSRPRWRIRPRTTPPSTPWADDLRPVRPTRWRSQATTASRRWSS